MVRIIFDIIIYLLAIYGASNLLVGIFHAVRQKDFSQSERAKLVLIVKNQEKTIEGIIRNILSGYFFRNITSHLRFFVLDLGSDDETVSILTRLKKQYANLEILGKNDMDKLFFGE